MNEQKRINPGRILLLVLAAVLLFNIFMNMRRSNDVTYFELRTLFEQEKVQEFTITDQRLSAKLSDGSTVGCDLYDFELFYNDLNELVQQQAADGIITNYNYWADHSTNWMEILLPCGLVLLGLVLLFGVYLVVNNMRRIAGQRRRARRRAARRRSRRYE